MGFDSNKKFEDEIRKGFDRANLEMERWASKNASASESQIASAARRIYGKAGVELSRNGRDYAREVMRRRKAA